MTERNPAFLFEAVVRPHRSLGPGGFAALMIFVSAVSFAAGLAFLLIGAWPVFGFFGLDVALIYMAFRASYRSARAREEIRVSADEILIRRIGADGQVDAEIRLNPFWARLEIERDADGAAGRMRLASHGARHPVADALSPPEREGFGRALSQALATARGA